jgi:hypothetical protein
MKTTSVLFFLVAVAGVAFLGSFTGGTASAADVPCASPTYKLPSGVPLAGYCQGGSYACGFGDPNSIFAATASSDCSGGSWCCVPRDDYNAATANASANTAASIGGIALPTDTGLSTTSIPTILSGILTFLLYMLGGVGVLAFVYAGFMYIFAGGDETKATEAKKIIIYSVVGIVVALVSLILVATVMNLIAGSVPLQ